MRKCEKVCLRAGNDGVNIWYRLKVLLVFVPAYLVSSAKSFKELRREIFVLAELKKRRHFEKRKKK